MRCYFCKNNKCHYFGNVSKEFSNETPCPNYDGTSDKLDGFLQNFNDIDDYD